MPEELPTRVAYVEAEWNGGPFDMEILRVPEDAPKVRVLVYRGAVSEVVSANRVWSDEEKAKLVEITVPVGMWNGKRRAWWHGRSPRI